MLTKKILQKAWEKAQDDPIRCSKKPLEKIEQRIYELGETIYNFINNLPDEPNITELAETKLECEHEWIYHRDGVEKCRKCYIERFKPTPLEEALKRYAEAIELGRAPVAKPETKPNWEKKFDDEFDYLDEPIRFDYLDEPIRVSGGHDYITHRGEMLTKGIKDFIRAELKAMGDEIKRYIDINYDHESALLYSLVDEVLKKRGVV